MKSIKLNFGMEGHFRLGAPSESSSQEKSLFLFENPETSYHHGYGYVLIMEDYRESPRTCSKSPESLRGVECFERNGDKVGVGVG